MINDIALQEILNKMDELVHDCRMELDRVTRELARLENIREDQFERLSREGNQERLQQDLEESDERILKLKKKRQRIQKAAAKQIREIRLSAETYRDEKIDDFKKRMNELVEERDALRDEVIPELQREIQELTEKKTLMDSQILTITSEINGLKRLTIETPELE